MAERSVTAFPEVVPPNRKRQMLLATWSSLKINIILRETLYD